ncbi:DUF1190 domain-containing protein [Rubrimonas cliftonensis]|uniref:Uncharacterized conserved protein YgiB, involved in bioifilm formation, UPF0441/DUF1190 family n=1 Tax=Rubrimonas cliftonensis TaxID=89524 RepID=A0A1H4GG89_9RHOB|nr:DUF1190 domain-containing protein [Rubrimonas cliftonensis]SEB08574.1 Uncharacterized conserved protein YgiB, involved in bioifilm formation, UPF0441/DUF1190 family [Rubrimonas cliftonensis]
MISRKRSRAASALLIGAGAFTLTACEEPRDLTFFENSDQCRRAADMAEFSAADCDAAFRTALAEHATQAPRYESLALCGEQHGAGVCAPPQAAGGVADDPQTQEAGFSYMPFIMGYMMGNMMRSGAADYVGRPLYRDARTGAMHSSGGDRMAFAAPGSKVSGSSAQIRPVTAARPAPPMTRAAVASAGGFGAARTAALRSVGG